MRGEGMPRVARSILSCAAASRFVMRPAKAPAAALNSVRLFTRLLHVSRFGLFRFDETLYAIELLAEFTFARGDGDYIEKHDEPGGQKAVKQKCEIACVHYRIPYMACAKRRSASISLRTPSWRQRSMMRQAANKTRASVFQYMGASMPGAIPPPFRMLRTGPGCWVRHHSMDFQTMTQSQKVKIESTAERRARWFGSSTARRSMR